MIMARTLHNIAVFKGLTIAHINMRSLSNKHEEVVRILAQSDIDILCISESWLKPFQPDGMFHVAGYNILRRDRTTNSGKTIGGGVLAYYKTRLGVDIIDDLCVCDPNLEVMWLKLKLTQTRPQYIGVTYRPPDGDLEAAIETLDVQISHIISMGNCDYMLIGDVNVDVRKSREVKCRRINDFYKSRGMKNLIRGITCHHHTGGTGIDHIGVNREEMFEKHGIVDIGVSDHSLIYAVRKQPKIEKVTKFIWGRSYRSFDPLLFERDIIFHNWEHVLGNPDVNGAWDLFNEDLITILNKHAPFRRMKISESLPKWVTREYVEACDTRDHHHQEYVHNKTPENLARKKRSRNYATKLKQTLKKEYFKKSIAECRGNSKKLWGKINEAFGKTATKSTVINELNGKTDPNDIVEDMNSYFVNIAGKLSKDFGEGTPTKTEQTLHQPKFKLSHVTVEEVRKLIIGLSDATAVGVDGISPRVLKAALDPLSIIICRIINRSFDLGAFPDGLKIARVTPIFKDGDRGDPGNYRPISVLPAISKLFERVAHSQLSVYLNKYSILSKSQFGFRRNHSTETCCLSMLDQIYKKLDRGHIGGVVFLDLKKAFDTVDHSILVRKLKSMGMADMSVAWFESYLADRKQQVKIDNVCSRLQKIKYGVPQGSILGPLLFLLFINDLCDVVELCGTSMYADDTAIYYLSDDVDDLQLTLQHDLQSISYWMQENRLNLNIKKTKFMRLGSKYRLNKTRQVGLSLNNEVIDTVETFKYLGMYLDSNLQFHTHIDNLVDKASNKLKLMYKTRWMFDQETALTLYKSLITPYLDYGSIIYEIAPEYQLKRLQVIQNSAARLILVTEPACPIYTLHERLKLDTLATRRCKTMVRIVYGCLHEEEPAYLFDCLVPVAHPSRVTRASEAGFMQVPRINGLYGSYGFSYRAPLQWNVTRSDLKAAVSKDQLKNLLKTSWYKTGIG